MRLKIQQQTEKVTVSGTASQLGVDPSQNAGQLVLRGNDLDAFSDDPEDLPTNFRCSPVLPPGPNGGQIFIDGFSDGVIPPKASIREIRVNQNPFSAEYDRVGFGRVEVLTKPGSDKYHGQASFDFGDRALTARNPYLIGPIVPNYRQEMFAGNFGGPISKKASFFIDVNRRITDENSLLNYTSLDSALNPVTISGAVVAPSHRFSISPRVDYALTPKQYFDAALLMGRHQRSKSGNQRRLSICLAGLLAGATGSRVSRSSIRRCSAPGRKRHAISVFPHALAPDWRQLGA